MIQIEQTVEDIKRLLMEQLIMPLRQLKGHLADASWHVTIEGNHDWTIAGYIKSVFSTNCGNREVTFTEKVVGLSTKFGFWTTHATKDVGVQLLTTYLINNTILFDRNFFGHKDLFRDQLSRLRKIHKSTTLEHGDRYIITGKTISHDSTDEQDDIAISALILVLVANEWIGQLNPHKKIKI